MPLQVMIVEDEMLLALDLEDMLLKAGHIVAGQASDMLQALSLAEQLGGRIDVAIMDVNLARGRMGSRRRRPCGSAGIFHPCLSAGTSTKGRGSLLNSGILSASSESPIPNVSCFRL